MNGNHMTIEYYRCNIASVASTQQTSPEKVKKHLWLSVCFEPSIDWIFPSFVTPTCQGVCIPSSLYQHLVSWIMAKYHTSSLISLQQNQCIRHSPIPEVEHPIFKKFSTNAIIHHTHGHSIICILNIPCSTIFGVSTVALYFVLKLCLPPTAQCSRVASYATRTALSNLDQHRSNFANDTVREWHLYL